MLQSKKVREYSHSYILKFIVLTCSSYVPKEKTKCLGIDTITLGVEPILNNKGYNPNGQPVVKLLNFQHNKHPNKNKDDGHYPGAFLSHSFCQQSNTTNGFVLRRGTAIWWPFCLMN